MWAGNSILFPPEPQWLQFFSSFFRFEYSSAGNLPLVFYALFFFSCSSCILTNPAHPALTRPPRPWAAFLCQVLICAKGCREDSRLSLLRGTDLCAREIKKEKRGLSVRFTSLSPTTTAALETDVLGHAGRRPYLILSATAQESGGASVKWRMWRDSVFGDLCLYEHQRKQGLSRERTFVLMERNFGKEWRNKVGKQKWKKKATQKGPQLFSRSPNVKMLSLFIYFFFFKSHTFTDNAFFCCMGEFGDVSIAVRSKADL